MQKDRLRIHQQGPKKTIDFIQSSTPAGRIVAVILLLLVTAAVYWQVGGHEFVYFDDNDYIVENRHVQEGLTAASVRWAFTAIHAANWHPLTWLSHMADRQFFGPGPAGPHGVNVFLHVLNTLLLMVLLIRMTGRFWQSALVAALFALHPLHVESVAWASERKDVLSTFFFLLTLLCYARYAERPGARPYLAVLVCFILGLMAKPMLVTLPFVMLLLDFWPLGRLSMPSAGIGPGVPPPAAATPLRRLLLEKIPFFLLTGASCVITLVAQRTAMVSTTDLPFGFRLANAVTSYAGYLLKAVWPVDLSVFYPLSGHIDPVRVVGAALLLTAITAGVIRGFGKRPYLLTGWLWYLGALVPVIGIIQVGQQAMADRYTYIPLIGIFVMAAWGLAEAGTRWPGIRKASIGAAILALTALTGLTWLQIGHWQNTLALLRNRGELQADNFVAEHAVGVALAKEGKASEARAHLENAVRLNPRSGRAYYDLGILIAKSGDYRTAIRQFLAAVRIEPDNPSFRFELGAALVEAGELDEAISEYTEVLRLAPEHLKARINLGVAFARKGNMPVAVEYFSQALELSPGDEIARRNLELARRMSKEKQ